MRTTIHSRMHALLERRSPGLWARKLSVRFAFATFALLLMVSGSPLHASTFPLPHHEDKLHKEIESLESQWRTAILHNDVRALEHLLADDYLGVTANGTLETKADAVALRRTGAVRISELQPSDTKVRVYGNTAVVTSRVEVAGHSDDHDISGTYRYTRVYNKRSGEWNIVSFEANRLPSSGSKH